MNIAVVVRQVPDLIEPLEIDDSGAALDFSSASFLVNESDDHALEQAILLKEAGGGTVTVIALDYGDVDNTLYTAAASGTIILSHERLTAEGDDLIRRARFEVIPTPAARPTHDRERYDGMVVAAAAPVVDDRREMLAILYGGDLLNRRYEIVDAIKQEVFPNEVYKGEDIGTVTIFQGDLRISTNVTMDDGSRAVGTRLSSSVCEAVLDRGDRWAAPAIVVNDWYITAYEPIRDPQDKIIGALYVGLLQAPFTHQRNVISAVLLTTVIAATLASLVLLVLANELVLSPIRSVVKMAQKVISGDLLTSEIDDLSKKQPIPAGPFQVAIEKTERDLLSHALEAAGGNKTAAAAALGMRPTTFRDKLTKHGLGKALQEY
ncbi:MAG: hypothetical protein GXY83_13420 [Rhodopirellula sp.]|nr:hypothetical protein [Rhodopirellula sp.]